MKGKKSTEPSGSRIADARFASFETDPRFRLPSKKKTKTKLDKRFSGMLQDKDFTDTSKVDRYGRKLKSDSKKKALERLYEPEDNEDEDEEDDEGGPALAIEVDDDNVVQEELRAAHEKDARSKYDPARGGGFDSSGSDSEDDDDSDSEGNDAAVEDITEGDIQKFQDEQAEVEVGEVTNRIAIVNLDWDHVKSTDLYALFSSFLGDEGGSIINVSVYPSEFGKERMQQEEVDGPPKELFKPTTEKDGDSSEDDSSDDEEDTDEKIKKELLQEGDDQDFDSDALRKYQLDRLRYYYAVMECSSPAVAKRLYDATDGTEYQSSSNFIDLRFVPDDVTFDDEPRDVCTRLPDSYKPVEFVTTALQSSKVKLTWDLHPEDSSRKESIKRAFTGSRADIDENDLRAYLASESEGEDEDDGKLAFEPENGAGLTAEDGGDEEPKLSKKELARKKMREALGLAQESAGKSSTKKGPVGEMQITFTPALADTTPQAEGEETTIEKYKRKERERKEKKREKARAKRLARGGDADSEDEAITTTAATTPHDNKHTTDDNDLGFDDPFFTTEDPNAKATNTKSSIRKEERRKKREAREAAELASSRERAHLTKVMAEDEDEASAAAEHLDHFDMNEIVRAEKIRSKKGKAAKSKKNRDKLEQAEDLLQEGFEMDVDDKRFQAVFDSHEFAIDPSNPKFKATGGMKKLLEEGRKKRKGDNRDDDVDRRGSSKKKLKERR